MDSSSLSEDALGEEATFFLATVLTLDLLKLIGRDSGAGSEGGIGLAITLTSGSGLLKPYFMRSSLNRFTAGTEAGTGSVVGGT